MQFYSSFLFGDQFYRKVVSIQSVLFLKAKPFFMYALINKDVHFINKISLELRTPSTSSMKTKMVPISSIVLMRDMVIRTVIAIIKI